MCVIAAVISYRVPDLKLTRGAFPDESVCDAVMNPKGKVSAAFGPFHAPPTARDAVPV